jgi:hypothetical protein
MRFLTGDPHDGGAMTFEEFAATWLPGVLRFAGVLTADRALAEDVVREVLIRTHARWNRIGAMDPSGVVCPEDGRQRVPVLAPKVLAAGARGPGPGRR